MQIENPPTNNPTTRKWHHNCFSRNLILMLVVIFVIFMVIISIAWLVMHPHEPSFGVTSLSVTNFTVSDSHQLQSKYEVGLTITNPNKIKMELVLYRYSILVLYGHEWPSVAAVQQQQHVFLEKMTNKSLKVDLVVRDSTKKEVPKELVKGWNKGVLNFSLKFSFKVSFEAGIWPSMDKLLDVCCENLDVFFSSKDTGKLLGIGKECHIVDAVKNN